MTNLPWDISKAQRSECFKSLYSFGEVGEGLLHSFAMQHTVAKRSIQANEVENFQILAYVTIYRISVHSRACRNAL